MKENIKKEQLNTNAIIIYETPNKEVHIDVKLDKETVWLNLNQIAALFNTDKSGISKHLTNIYADGELIPNATVAKIATVRKEGTREINRVIEYYNLDAIISVGYRVNSKRATQFRIWATKALKEYLTQGFVLNEKRLLETQQKFKELQTTIQFMEEKSKQEMLLGHESEILNLLSIYAKTLTLLDAYDNGVIKDIKGVSTDYILTYKNALKVLAELKTELIAKKEATDLFGNEREIILLKEF